MNFLNTAVGLLKKIAKPIIGKEIITHVGNGSIVRDLPGITVDRISIEKQRALLKDGHVESCIGQRKHGVQSLSWRLKADKLPQDQRDFFENLIKEWDLPGIIDDITDAALYGRQVLEITWGAGYVPTAITGKPYELFARNKDGVLCFINGIELQPLPEMNFIVSYHRRKWGLNEGMGILEIIFWNCFVKKATGKFWARFLETFVTPYIVMRHRPDASDEEINSLVEMGENLINAAVAAIPTGDSVEIMEAKGKSASSDIFEKNIAFQNAEISKAIVGQTLTTEQGKKGSHALGKVHMGVLWSYIQSDARIVEKTINEVLSRCAKFHFKNGKAPVFELYSPEREAAEKKQKEDSQKSRSSRDNNLCKQGVRFTRKYYLRTYELNEDDIEELKKKEETDTETKEFSAGPKGFEKFADEQTAEQLAGIQDTVREFMDGCKNLEEFKDGLFDLFEHLDGKDFEDAISAGMALAYAEGYNEAAGE